MDQDLDILARLSLIGSQWGGVHTSKRWGQMVVWNNKAQRAFYRWKPMLVNSMGIKGSSLGFMIFS